MSPLIMWYYTAAAWCVAAAAGSRSLEGGGVAGESRVTRASRTRC